MSEAKRVLEAPKKELWDAAGNAKDAATHVKKIGRFAWRLLVKLQRNGVPNDLDEELSRTSIIAASAQGKCQNALGMLRDQLTDPADAGNNDARTALACTAMSIEHLGEGVGINEAAPHPFVQTAVDQLRSDIEEVQRLHEALENRLAEMSKTAATLQEVLKGVGGGQDIDFLEYINRPFEGGPGDWVTATYGPLGSIPTAISAIESYQRGLG